MHLRSVLRRLYKAVDNKFTEQFGFRVKDTTLTKITQYFHVPKDSSSLAVTRILYGLAMLFDIPDERGGATMDRRWGSPTTCHFPLLPMVQAISMPYMAIVYTALWIGALGIMLGYKFRLTAVLFTVCYWYLFLIEKSFWNNHSYLFGLVALLLSFTQANCYWSIDSYLDPSKSKDTVPYWNYFLLKYQFFILYFMAGMKKGTAEWLTGYSVLKLSEHWVFNPFKLFLTVPQIDYLIVHLFVFLFDLTVAIWMMWGRTRHYAMFFCAMFHLMNSRLFRIGMFPWVCLATMPLYYPFDWPKLVLNFFKEKYLRIQTEMCSRLTRTTVFWCNCPIANKDVGVSNDELNSKKLDVIEDLEKKTGDEVKEMDVQQSLDFNMETVITKIYKTSDIIKEIHENKEIQSESEEGKDEHQKQESNDVDRRKKLTTCLIILYVVTQAFLPYSHFITKGYNNWTNGLYGYSWDMMVHTWDTQTVIVKIVDNQNNNEYFIDPTLYTVNDRWSRHGDMVYQYAHCLKENLLKERQRYEDPGISTNLSVYIDVWCSMNGRFTQRLFDSKIDLLQASWSPFENVPFLMPLLDEALSWRSKLEDILEDVHSWSNSSDVIFLADYPNYEQERYMPVELSNITLTVLEGIIAFEPEVTNIRKGQSHRLTSGNQIGVATELFHKVVNIGKTPAYYMYTFSNETGINNDGDKTKPKLPILTELKKRIENMFVFATLIVRSMFQILFGCIGEC